MKKFEAQIIIEVSDKGIGISSDLLPNIFDLFAQGNRDYDRTQGGLGIGLALVKHVVTMHGGNVTASSDGINTGSTFKVTLAALETSSELPISARNTVFRPSIKLRILLVDDNLDAVTLLGSFLEINGHYVNIAHSSAEALKLAENEIFDAYLIDIGLPEMDGKELARHLKNNFSNSE